MIESIAGTIEKVTEKTVERSPSFFRKLESSIDVDKPEIVKREEIVKMFWSNLENDYLSTYEDRIKQTPTDKNTERGNWDGERGESKYVPSSESIQEILKGYGLDGIIYNDGIPDFTSCSEATVEIDDMSENRLSNKEKGVVGNFDQADQKYAEQWNKEGREGRNDWTTRDVSNWRRENGYSWHECNDRTTCQLISTEINDYFGHLSEYDRPLMMVRESSEIGEVNGGSYGEIRNNMKERGDSGQEYEVHHMPADSATEIDYNDGPTIKMEKTDHLQTASWGKSKDAQEYRAQQKELIEQGKFREAAQMDIDDIRDKFGDKYDSAIAEYETYLDKLEAEGQI